MSDQEHQWDKDQLGQSLAESMRFVLWPSNSLIPSSPSNGEGNDTALQYSCLENPMDVRAW